jgi:hypothetical protein
LEKKMALKDPEKTAERFFELCSKQQSREDDVFLSMLVCRLSEEMANARAFEAWAMRNSDLVDGKPELNEIVKRSLELTEHN